jgi:hypothetical protein
MTVASSIALLEMRNSIEQTLKLDQSNLRNDGAQQRCSIVAATDPSQIGLSLSEQTLTLAQKGKQEVIVRVLRQDETHVLIVVAPLQNEQDIAAWVLPSLPCTRNLPIRPMNEGFDVFLQSFGILQRSCKTPSKRFV